MTALYNEIDPFAAEWLENLIAAGKIAPGIVDRRSIEDLEPDFVRSFTQVHFFAGIGVWSLGLRAAGWADDRPVWTGSCPCQPFSAAGQGDGFDDERHLWPAMHHLIEVCRPGIVLGEQVASKLGLAWFDLVSSDLEASNYAAGAVDTCAAGFGSPNIRQRLWWVGLADATGGGQSWESGGGVAQELGVTERCVSGGVADADNTVRRAVGSRGDDHNGVGSEWAEVSSNSGTCSKSSPGPTNGRWRLADWLRCRDEKWRPVEPGSFPLVDALPRGMGTMGAGLQGLVDMAGIDAGSLKRARAFRTGTLRGFGNGLNAAQTEAFARAVMDAVA